jgi:hypothetical protein
MGTLLNPAWRIASSAAAVKPSTQCPSPKVSQLENPASLILGKVYCTLPDAEAEAHNMLRIIDEDTSEPDSYLYPAAMFAPIELPEVAKRVLMAAGG